MGGHSVTPRYTYRIMHTSRLREIYISKGLRFCKLTLCERRLFQIPPWNPTPARDESESRLIPPTAQTELEVITAIQNLANNVIANAASRSLARYVSSVFTVNLESDAVLRMKSRPEYRPVFSSPAMFFRALHIISTQRYRLPVRRYILDLFSTDLDANTVETLTECAKTLKAPPSFKPSKSENSRVISMFGRLGRSRRASESDEEGDELDPPEDQNIVVEDLPVFSLQPVSHIVGFAI